MNAREILITGANELDVFLSSKQIDLFFTYLEALQLWNKKISLTSFRDDKEIIIKHFLDSVTIIHFIESDSRVLDIGSGAGFPGVPLKIVRPSIDVTLLDSVQKKVFFLLDVIRKLRLEGINALCGRAEAMNNGVKRNYFDFVVTRAVGSIKNLIELSIPYIVGDGKIVLMRGKKGLEEWSKAKNTIAQGFRLIRFKKLILPFTNQQRVILIIGR